MSNTPTIRFKGFSDDWELRKFEDIFSVSQGLQIPIKDRFTEDGNNRYFYITNEFLKDSCSETYYIESPSESVICDEEDILMTRTGNTGIIVTDVNGCFHNNFFKIKYDKTVFSKRFICYLLSSPMMQKIILNSAGSSTIPDLSHKNFYKISSRFPCSKNEQNSVGNFLFHLDHLITLHQQKCNDAKLLKKYMLKKMFPQNGQKVPEIRFSGFTDDWEQRKLEDYLEVSSEKNRDELLGKEDVLSVSGEVGIVNQIEFQGRSFAGVSVANYGIVEVGDVVYTKSPLKSNPYGIIKTNKGKTGIVSTLYAVYKPKKNVDSEFVQIYFESDFRMNSYMHPLVNKGAKNDMKVSDANALKGPVFFPKIEEQIVISQYFNSLDHLITLHQQKCDKLKEMKKYMLQNMFPQKG